MAADLAGRRSRHPAICLCRNPRRGLHFGKNGIGRRCKTSLWTVSWRMSLVLVVVEMELNVRKIVLMKGQKMEGEQ